MPHSSPDSHPKNSGKTESGSGARHDITAETTSDVGYVSHRQAWAERKKKKSGDKVSCASSLHRWVVADLNDHGHRPRGYQEPGQPMPSRTVLNW